MIFLLDFTFGWRFGYLHYENTRQIKSSQRHLNETTNSLGVKFGFHYFSWAFIIHFIWYEYDASVALDACKKGQFDTRSLKLLAFLPRNRSAILRFLCNFMQMPGGFGKCLKLYPLVTDVISSSNWISVTAIFHVFKINSVKTLLSEK